MTTFSFFYFHYILYFFLRHLQSFQSYLFILHIKNQIIIKSGCHQIIFFYFKIFCKVNYMFPNRRKFHPLKFTEYCLVNIKKSCKCSKGQFLRFINFQIISPKLSILNDCDLR